MSRESARLAKLLRTDPAAAADVAARIEAREEDARRRKLMKSLPRRRDEAAEEARVAERHRVLVARVMLRAGAYCELGEHVHLGPLDPHHLEGGPAKEKHEKLSNVISACRAHHDAFEIHRRTFVPAVKRWCAKYGYPLPRRREYRDE